ncbi:hypothetical protein DMC30DRAFT_46079 [Rhodotorula diobovata]|uniref:Uncharacterized protein n=1 Tax=Rhodotorula diobovata TaxID=5288 RepID=A0A5C5G2F3_9BASI|nr:hypothetical protein DMC30DRAFT_46079 [Rhodotorula diobovata]
MRSGPRLLAPDRRLRGHGRQPLRPLPLAAPRRICSPFALPHRDNDDMTSRRTTVQNVVKALDAVCEAWDAGDRSPQLIREWLNATLHLVHTYGTSWGTEYRDLVKVELVKLAAQLRENPDWLWTEASEVSYNTEFAETWFPQLNTLFNHSGQSARESMANYKPPSHGRPKRGGSRQGPESRSPARSVSGTTTEHLQHSLPHSARHLEQYKLTRLRPVL